MNEPSIRSRAVDPEPDPAAAGAKTILQGWSRSQKLLDGGTGAWNLGSASTEIACWASELYKQYNVFLIFWNNLFWSRNQMLLDVGAGAKKYRLDARSWSRSLKFEYRLRSLGTHRTYWRYHCFVTYKNGAAMMRTSHLLLRNYTRTTIMPARMKANGNFSDASVERFYSIRTNRMMSPSNAVDLDRPCNSLFESQVVHRYVFIVA